MMLAVFTREQRLPWLVAISGIVLLAGVTIGVVLQ